MTYPSRYCRCTADTRCVYCAHKASLNRSSAAYVEHYTPAPKRIETYSGGEGGIQGCRGVVNEGVGWDTYTGPAVKMEKKGGCCVIM